MFCTPLKCSLCVQMHLTCIPTCNLPMSHISSMQFTADMFSATSNRSQFYMQVKARQRKCKLLVFIPAQGRIEEEFQT